jgi:hypothetical protein
MVLSIEFMAPSLAGSCYTRLLSVWSSTICSVSWSPTHAWWVKNCNNCVHKKHLTSRSAESVCESNKTGSGLYRRSWTSLPTLFISAQWLSERTVQLTHKNCSFWNISRRLLHEFSWNSKPEASFKICWSALFLRIMVHYKPQFTQWETLFIWYFWEVDQL